MTVLSDDQLAAVLRKAGVDAGHAAYLVAIAHPESGANAAAVQQGQPYATTGWGLWQITPGNSEPQFGINQALLNPQKNADAAAAKLKSQGLGAWTTYTGGLYRPYFGAAEQAVSHVYGLSQAQVDKLAASAGKGGGITTTAAQGGGGSPSPWGAWLGGIIHGLVPAESWGTAFSQGQAVAGAAGGLEDVATAVSGIANTIFTLEQKIAWFFVPNHWIRIFAGIAGVWLTGIGVIAMSRTGRSYTASVAGVPVPAPGGQLAPALGILEVTAGAVLLFIAFHNLPDNVQTFPQFLSHLQQQVQSGNAASTTASGAHVSVA